MDLDSSAPVSGARLSRAARWIIFGVLVTNIGNGMHMITVGKYFYDQTGSASAFGLVLLAEYVIGFGLQLFAGSLVDRGDACRISIWSDLGRGAFIIGASLLLNGGAGVWWIVASILVINLAKPFYRAATFALGPAVAEGAGLVRYNALSAGFAQAGQLLGVALVGPVIYYSGVGLAFALNGLSFLISGLALWFARPPSIPRKPAGRERSYGAALLDDWKEIIQLLRAHRTLVWHLLLCAGDFLAVSCVNLALVPLVSQRYGGNGFWLSAFDGAFAVGAMVSAGVVERLIRSLSLRISIFFGLASQGLLFFGLAAVVNPYAVAGLMLLIGLMNACSLTVFLSHLQQRSHGPIKGRIAMVRGFFLSALAAVLLPLITAAQTVSLNHGLLASGLLCFGFALLAFALARPRVFGTRLIGVEG